MTLLDDDSRAVLGLLRRTAQESQQALQHSTAPHGHRNPLASDITNRPAKVVRPPSACLWRHLPVVLLCTPFSVVASHPPAHLYIESEEMTDLKCTHDYVDVQADVVHVEGVAIQKGWRCALCSHHSWDEDRARLRPCWRRAAPTLATPAPLSLAARTGPTRESAPMQGKRRWGAHGLCQRTL